MNPSTVALCVSIFYCSLLTVSAGEKIHVKIRDRSVTPVSPSEVHPITDREVDYFGLSRQDVFNGFSNTKHAATSVIYRDPITCRGYPTEYASYENRRPVQTTVRFVRGTVLNVTSDLEDVSPSACPEDQLMCKFELTNSIMTNWTKELGDAVDSRIIIAIDDLEISTGLNDSEIERRPIQLSADRDWISFEAASVSMTVELEFEASVSGDLCLCSKGGGLSWMSVDGRPSIVGTQMVDIKLYSEIRKMRPWYEFIVPAPSE